MDDIDKNIIGLLRKNSRISNLEISQKVHLAPSAVHKRVRKLEADKVIDSYTVRVDHGKLGLNMNVLIQVTTGESVGSTLIGESLAAFPEICDVFDVAGNANYIVRAVVKDTAGLNDLIIRMGKLPGVIRTQTTLIMNVLKNELTSDF